MQAKPTALGLKEVRNAITPLTDYSIGMKAVDINGSTNSTLIVNEASALFGVVCGALRMMEVQASGKKSSIPAIGKVKIISGALQLAKGVAGCAANGLNIVAMKTIATAAKTHLTAIGKIFGKAGSGLGAAFLSFAIVPGCKKIHQARKLKELLKDKEKSNNDDDVKKLKKELEITELDNEEIKKAANKVILKNAVTLAIALLAIVGSILGIIFSGGIGATIALVISIVAGTGMGVIDFASMIEAVKKATGINSKARAIKILTIIVAIVSAVVSVVLAPSLAVGIAAAVVGSLMIVTPLGSLIYLEKKQARREEEEKRRAEEEKNYRQKVKDNLEANRITCKNSEELKKFLENKDYSDFDCYDSCDDINIVNGNLKFMKAVNEALPDRQKIFNDNDNHNRLNSNNKLVLYTSYEDKKGTKELFMDSAKTRIQSAAKKEEPLNINLQLSGNEKISRQLLKTLNEFSSLTINGINYNKEVIDHCLGQGGFTSKGEENIMLNALTYGLQILDPNYQGTGITTQNSRIMVTADEESSLKQKPKQKTTPEIELFKALMTDTEASIKSKTGQEPFTNSKFNGCDTIVDYENVFAGTELMTLIENYSARST